MDQTDNKGIINTTFYNVCPLWSTVQNRFKMKHAVNLCISSISNRGIPFQLCAFATKKHILRSISIAKSHVHFIGINTAPYKMNLLNSVVVETVTPAHVIVGGVRERVRIPLAYVSFFFLSECIPLSN